MPPKKEPQPFLPQAGRTSVTVIHDSTKSYGLRLVRQNNGKDKNDDILIDMVANHHCNGLLKDAPMNEGDILKTINNRKASAFLGCRDSIGRGSFPDGQSVTFVTERPSENVTAEDGAEEVDELDIGSPVIRAFCRRSVSPKNDGRAMRVGVEFHRVFIGDEDGNEEEKINGGSTENDCETDSDGDRCPSSSTEKSSFLQIDRIDPNGLFAHSVLNQGDIVLAINGYSICVDENTTVEEANELMGVFPESEQASSMPPGVSVFETVDILALNPRKLLELKQQNVNNAHWMKSSAERRSWMKRQVKKAGVALGGSAMIGAGIGGAIIGVHPFGTLLFASGVSFLGTEFETPNRIVRSTRNSLEKWSMEDEQIEFSKDDSEISENSETELQEESTTTSNGMSDNNTKFTPPSPPLPPRPTMASRMKGLGRRYVLPLLDRMAGDRRMSSGMEVSSSFDISDNFSNATTTNMPQKPHGQLETQQGRNQLQGRDDLSPKQGLRPSAVSQRMA